MEVTLYNLNGEVKKEKISVPDEIFTIPWNDDLIYQVVYVYKANQRKGRAHTKTRAEVRGGGRKPWPQKHTGRARHGSIRSPIWVGGGVSHGPRKEKIYKRKINKKMRKKATLMVLSRKLRDNQLFFINGIGLSQPKTKQAFNLLKKISQVLASHDKKPNFLIITKKVTPVLKRSFKNIKKVKITNTASLNALRLLEYKYLILTQESLQDLKNNFLKINGQR